jgi:hypothetical protein
MRRLSGILFVAAAMVAGCVSQPGAPAPSHEVAATTLAATPAPAPTADPAIAAARSHILATLTALQDQANIATSSAAASGNVYPVVQAIQHIVDDEVDWLNTQPASVLEVTAISDFKVRLLAYQPLGQQTLTHFYDGTVDSNLAGRTLQNLLLVRPDISAIVASQSALTAPTPTPAAAATPENLQPMVIDGSLPQPITPATQPTAETPYAEFDARSQLFLTTQYSDSVKLKEAIAGDGGQPILASSAVAAVESDASDYVDWLAANPPQLCYASLYQQAVTGANDVLSAGHLMVVWATTGSVSAMQQVMPLMNAYTAGVTNPLPQTCQ